MDRTVAINGWRASLMRLIWLPFSLISGLIVLAGMTALEFVFEQRQQVKREQGLLWGLLSVSYWILGAIFTGEWRWGKDNAHSVKA